MNIINRIVSSVGRRIDGSSPMVAAGLADGSRVHAQESVALWSLLTLVPALVIVLLDMDLIAVLGILRGGLCRCPHRDAQCQSRRQRLDRQLHRAER